MALSEMPIHVPLVDENGKMNRVWVIWFTKLAALLESLDV